MTTTNATPHDPGGKYDRHDKNGLAATAEAGPPATDLQLIRLGRHLGLSLGEAEALLEVLEEEDSAPQVSAVSLNGGAGPRRILSAPLMASLRRHGPQLLFYLRAVPGLFLFTDGITLSRLERALSRLDGAQGSVAKLRGFLAKTRRAIDRETHLFEGAVQALHRGAVSGMMPGGGPLPGAPAGFHDHGGRFGPGLLALLSPVRRAFRRAVLQAHRQTRRQADRQAHRQADPQTHRQSPASRPEDSAVLVVSPPKE